MTAATTEQICETLTAHANALKEIRSLLKARPLTATGSAASDTEQSNYLDEALEDLGKAVGYLRSAEQNLAELAELI